ncbi:MAG: GatB/YqeY domain-containing protein [Candidatus Dormibacteraeota bacterium]|nr:GatB/YqeY domain-containing protein [Candidatus Dormibacteraeota bacterium]
MAEWALFERVEADMMSARKAREQAALDALSLLKSEVSRAAKEPGAKGLSDELVIQILRKELKKREEAAEQYAAAGRKESAQRETDQAKVLQRYLPAQLSDAALESELRAVIAEVKPSGVKDFGAVMKAATARLAGRTESGRIAATARRLLA